LSEPNRKVEAGVSTIHLERLRWSALHHAEEKPSVILLKITNANCSTTRRAAAKQVNP
jgi:hypothetical protein